MTKLREVFAAAEAARAEAKRERVQVPRAVPILVLLGLVLVVVTSQPGGRTALEWQSEPWMQADENQPEADRILAITDLPPLGEGLKAEDFAVAVEKSRAAGCKGAVLTYSWPSLEPREGSFTLRDLGEGVALNRGRVLFLGIQVLNTTVKEVPTDLQAKSLDDPEVLRRFRKFLDGLAPLLRNRIRYLSIGNESDIYLSANPDELPAFVVFFESARQHAKSIAPHLVVGTTLSAEGATRSRFHELLAAADAHFLTYYHGKSEVADGFQDSATTRDALLAMAANLDDRPIVFQELGYPASDEISSEQKQAAFVTGVFDAWDELGARVPFVNYFMMYDFPDEMARQQMSYYGVDDEEVGFLSFVTSLGLHRVDRTPRAGWDVFMKRGQRLAAKR